jgi:hypothetical protein
MSYISKSYFVGSPLEPCIAAIGNPAVYAHGGTAPYTYSTSSGNLPPGLSLNITGGCISGTPTMTGSYRFTASAVDYYSCPANSSSNIIVVTCPSMAITPATLGIYSTGSVGTYYTFNMTCSQQTTNKTWSISSGSLPAGIFLTASTARTASLEGTPTTEGHYYFTVKVVDVYSVCTGSINYGPLTIYPVFSFSSFSSPLTTCTVISQSITASGAGAVGPFVYSTSSGNIPTGLALYSASGMLYGTASVAGTYNFTYKVVDAGGFSGSSPYSITVVNPTVTLTPTQLSGGISSSVYPTTQMTASGGTSPYTYTISSGSLPSGLTLSSGGSLSGTPSQTGSYPFYILAADACSTSGSASYSISICPYLVITASLI